MKNERSFAFFVTPHGFGHAARGAAVMEAMHRLEPHVRFEIFTQVPLFFFQESLPGVTFGYHDLMTDVGMAQLTSLEVDLKETLRRLDEFIPFTHEFLAPLSEQLKGLGCEAVICEIAPMGIAVARAAGIPSVLVENFTWDWIYDEFSGGEHSMCHHVDYLQRLFGSVDHHLQTEPAFYKDSRHILTPPVSRRVRTDRTVTRRQLGIPKDKKMVMITLGGIPAKLSFLDRLHRFRDVVFVLPGSKTGAVDDNIIYLPYNSGYYHPDLIDAADAVIGKPGYSTVAEVYQSGVPFGYVPRPTFRESAVLEAFMRRAQPGFPIPEETFNDASWLDRLPELLAMERVPHNGDNGATQVARYILNIHNGNGAWA